MEKEKEYYLFPIENKEVKYGIKKPEIGYELPYLGSVRARRADEIEGSNWLLGCETLDRGYADYDQYKDYLRPLGIKYLRFQGGWAKTEKSPGVYEWGWLDHIIDDAVSKGLKPWLQTGYGNPIYPGAGGENLGAGMPLSESGKAAYEKWVAAMVCRYGDRVKDWEVWNEPNFGDNKVNTPEITAEFNYRTAKIIKKFCPDARISALALGHIDIDYAERFFRWLYEKNACGLFHNVTYHDYCYNPDANKLSVYRMRQVVEKYAPHLIMRQGENGAPSVPNAGGALAGHEWSELSQAKWDTRRMLENLGNDIECSVFSIVEMQYKGNGPITKTNTKGLLMSDSDNVVIRPKIAYYAVQNVTAVFDSSLERVKGAFYSHRLEEGDTDRYWYNSDRSISVYAYQKKGCEKRIYTIWKDDAIPGDDCSRMYLDFAFSNSNFTEPVLVDIITGCIYKIPEEQWKKEGGIDYFKDIPVYDAPILIAERSLVNV